MRGISLCYPYYANPGMLAEQYRTWAAYPDALKSRCEVVICDDGSPTPAADVPRPDGLPKLSIYRIEEDRPWNQHAARNVAAHHAARAWLLMSDMDHVLPADSLARVLEELEDIKKIYKFRRLDAPDLEPKMKNGREHPHPNTYAIHKKLYWWVGGYDERLSGVYGTDSLFRKTSEARGAQWIQTDIEVVRYAREVIPDASTTRWDRDRYRDSARKKEIGRLLRDGEPPLTMTNEYDKVV